MKLKSLTLQGFKSFPEKTVIQFHEGVTAIVGPNGSGKSNITDAIRWVLGEQSVKTLRSNKMEELIFTGTSSRRALSYAEVTLTMDNSDYALAVDYEEIRVSRRIYRSGESEYLINDSKCRLKDITEMFLDTGIGRDGYSMIGQGRVDDVLSGKAELRRKMIDEASGITKYKIRKEEAGKKLAHTEQNLIRVNDILGEIEKQKAPLERQAKKAKRFLELHEELKAIDLALLYYDIDQKEKEQKRFIADEESLNKNIEDANWQKQEIMKRSAENREKLQTIAQTLELLQKEEDEAREELTNYEQRKALATQELAHMENRRLRYEEQNQELEARLLRLQKEAEEKQEQDLATQEIIRQLEKELATIEEAVHVKQQARADRLLRQGELTSDLQTSETKLQDIRQQIQREETNREVLRSHLNMLEKELIHVDEELNQEDNNAQSLRLDLEDKKSTREKLEIENQTLERARESLRLKLAEKKQVLQEKAGALANLEYQKKTQEDLQESYEGYSYSVKNIMEFSRNKPEDVLGPMADLLEVPREFETAIESILGGTAQHIVVRREEVARDLIETLKKNRWGRATFLPLTQVQGNFPPDNLLKQIHHMPGYLGLAHELVKFPEEVRDAAEYALGRTVVAQNLELALKMAKTIGFRVRICSLDGDLLNPGGSMSGGSKKQNTSGILSRKRVLEDISNKIMTTNAEGQALQEEISILETQEVDVEQRLADLTMQVYQISREELLLESHIDQYEQNRYRLSSQMEQNQADKNRMDKELAEQEKQILEYNTREEDLLKRISQAKEELNRTQALIAAEESTLEEQGEERYGLREKLAKHMERQDAERKILERVQNEIKQVEEESTQRAQDLIQDEAKAKDLLSLLHDDDNAYDRLQSRVQDTREKITEAKARQESSNLSLERSSEEMNTISGYLSKLGVEQGRLEQRLENTGNTLMELRSRLWEDYAQTFANKDTWFNEAIHASESRAQVKKLRQEIKDLGNVNVQAIEESKEINERFLFLDQQRTDILQAQKDLEIVINDIVQGMKEQFSSSFTFINEQFSKVFKDLFGGGEAELVLDDHSDILNSNIDIKVSPPGKRLQNMLALSGGERCLTAIALLFAIQQLNPSPFCVLDEVEAALDEANVFRFTEYINKNAEDTQYILVTHRRGTMEAARMIYGVTMQERGVSSIISVKLDEGA